MKKSPFDHFLAVYIILGKTVYQEFNIPPVKSQPETQDIVLT